MTGVQTCALPISCTTYRSDNEQVVGMAQPGTLHFETEAVFNSLLKYLPSARSEPQRRRRDIFIESTGKAIQAPWERHVRLVPGMCRSCGACALFDGKIYKHVAPTALKRVFQQAANRH